MVATDRVTFRVEAGLMETGKETPVKATGVVRGKAVTDLKAVIRAATGQVADIRVVTEQAAAIRAETGPEAVIREAAEQEADIRVVTEREAGIRAETEQEAGIRATGQTENAGEVAGKVEKDKAVVIREVTDHTAAIREATDLMVIVPVEVIRAAIGKVGISRGVDTREETIMIKEATLHDHHAVINQVDMGKAEVITRVI